MFLASIMAIIAIICLQVLVLPTPVEYKHDTLTLKSCNRDTSAVVGCPHKHTWSKPFFSNIFSKANFLKKFGKVWKNSLEKVWKKVWKPERAPKEHVSNSTICPALS
jgi:hypothetical protein